MISTATTARRVIARRRTTRRWCPSTRGHAGDGSGSVTAGHGGAAGIAWPWSATAGLGQRRKGRDGGRYSRRRGERRLKLQGPQDRRDRRGKRCELRWGRQHLG